MSIRKFKPSSPDKALGKIKGDTEYAKFGHLNRLVDDINTDLSGIPNVSHLGFKKGSIGDKVSFKKNDYVSTKDIIIPGVLEIARGTNQGLYNAAIDNSYESPGPANTEWSSYYINPEYANWAPLWDLGNRTFGSWVDALDTPNDGSMPAMQPGMHMVMRETTTGRMWLIMFSSWTPGGNGGGFAYDRWEILSGVNFEKPDYETQVVDKISAGVWLAREDYGPLYNAVNETYSEQRVSPKNTRWNSLYVDERSGYSGFDDLSNLESRVYEDFTYALDHNIGNNILDTPLIMHDLTTDLYYKFEFTSWTQNGNGGGFAYTKTVIPQSKPIVFGDGSVMNTAASGGSGSQFPYVDANGNTIIADSSNNLVNLGPGETHLIDDFSGMVMVNDHYDGGVELWICGGGDCIIVLSTSAAPGGSTFTQSGNGYEWTNVDNLQGPFTFTVVKTRNGA